MTHYVKMTYAEYEELQNRICYLTEALELERTKATLSSAVYTSNPKSNITRASSTKRRWSRREVADIHASVDNGETIQQLASRLDRTISAIKTHAYALGYKTTYDKIIRSINE